MRFHKQCLLFIIIDCYQDLEDIVNQLNNGFPKVQLNPIQYPNPVHKEYQPSSNTINNKLSIGKLSAQNFYE